MISMTTGEVILLGAASHGRGMRPVARVGAAVPAAPSGEVKA